MRKLLWLAALLLSLGGLVQGQDSVRIYRGSLGDKHIEMRFTSTGPKVTGTYFYDQFKQDISLEGAYDAKGQLELLEGVGKKATGKFVGRIGFLNPVGWPAFEVGWTLAKQVWGKGYATEGGRRALEYAFNELDKSHVISLIHPDNKGSIAVAERLGEKVEGKTELMGHDVLIYGIDRPAK